MGSLITDRDRHTAMVEMSASVMVNASTSFIQVEEESRTEMFHSDLLADLDLNSSHATFSPAVTVSNPGSGLRLRPLCLEDYDRGYLSLLGQLTSVGDITRAEWEARWLVMRECQATYFVIVLEDTALGHVGRLEDVVVSDQYRGRQLGKLLVTTASLLAV